VVKRIFLLVFGLILVIFSVLFWRQFSQTSLSHGRKTVILKINPLTIISWQDNQELIYLTIPQNAYLQTSRGFGQYRISSLEELGRLENLDSKLLLETLRDLLGTPLDGIEANLNWPDRLRLWYFRKNLSQSKIRNLDLEKNNVFSPRTLPDESVVLVPDQEKIDQLLADVFKDDLVTKEQLTIEVLNASGQAGAGARAARLIANLGTTVISVNNNPQIIKQCQLHGNPNTLKSLTAQKIQKMFACEIKSSKLEGSRSDLQLIVTR